MVKYIIKRILFAIFTIWAVVTITFILMNLIPGNPFATEGSMSDAAYQNMISYYHLDDPMYLQYFSYLKSVATFDFGPSMVSATIDANYYIHNGLPISIQLGLQALFIAIIGGLFLGTVAALNHNKFLDYLAIVIVIIGVSVPSFIMARILIMIFAQKLDWFPVSGWSAPINTVLPTIALAALPLAQITRMMRSSMLETLNQDYIKTARAKGLSNKDIIFKHAFKNAILPIVSVLGTITAGLLTGSFVIEQIFAIPGMGDALVNSVNNRDYPVIMASTVVYCVILITLTLIIDLIYPFVDPRIDIIGGGKNG